MEESGIKEKTPRGCLLSLVLQLLKALPLTGLIQTLAWATQSNPHAQTGLRKQDVSLE